MFFVFLRIGAFTIGGAYAMIPLIRREIVQKQKWLTDEDFLDGLAAAQSCPGPISANIGVYIGYRMGKLPGMLIAVLGIILPSFISILIIAMFFGKISELDATRRIFHGLKPAVVALIAVPVIQMSKAGGIRLGNFWFPLSAAILVGFFKFSPIYLIIMTIVYAVAESLLTIKRNPIQ